VYTILQHFVTAIKLSFLYEHEPFDVALVDSLAPSRRAVEEEEEDPCSWTILIKIVFKAVTAGQAR